MSNKKYCNLYSFVKTNNKDLIPIIEDLCAEGLFKGRGAKTFLNPNSKLIAELDNEINKGNSEHALKLLKSLFLNDIHESINKSIYVTFNNKELDGSTIQVEKSKKFKKFNDTLKLNVFDLVSSDFPKEGKEVDNKKGSKSYIRGSNDIDGGKELSSRIEITNELINAYIANSETHIFAYAVNSLLSFLKKKDGKAYESVFKLVDSNLIVSWYILVQPTARMSSKHISDSLFKRWAKSYYKSPIKNVELLKELFTSNDYDNKELKQIIEKRKTIGGVGLKETIADVIKCYDNNYCKLLEDELRFRFGDSVELDSEDIMTLNLVDWDKPRKSLVLFENIPKSNLLQSEIFKVINKFIKSNAFLYTPYNDDIVQKIKKTISGAGSENSGNSLHIFGGENTEKIKKMHCGSLDFSLEAFVGGLSSEQINELKSLL